MNDITNADDVRDNALRRLDDLVREQARARAALVAELERAEVQAAADLRASLRTTAGTRIADAIDDVARQIKRDRRADRLLAAMVPVLPSWAAKALPDLRRQSDDDGERRRVLLFVGPGSAADGRRAPVAIALVDLSAEAFGADVASAWHRDREDDARIEREHRAAMDRADEAAEDRRARPRLLG